MPDGNGRSAPSRPSRVRAGPACRAAWREFESDPGEITLRFTARGEDESTVDRWTLKVEVPNPRQCALVLGSPVFRRARSPLEFRDHPPGRRHGAHGLADVPPDRPRAGRTGPASARRRREPSSRLDLLNRAGQVLVSLPAPAPRTGQDAVRTAGRQPRAEHLRDERVGGNGWPPRGARSKRSRWCREWRSPEWEGRPRAPRARPLLTLGRPRTTSSSRLASDGWRRKNAFSVTSWSPRLTTKVAPSPHCLRAISRLKTSRSWIGCAVHRHEHVLRAGSRPSPRPSRARP